MKWILAAALLAAGAGTASAAGADDTAGAVIQPDNIRLAAADNSGQTGRHLGDINEDSPLMAPPKTQLFGEPITPLGKNIAPLSRPIAPPGKKAAPNSQPQPLGSVPLAELTPDNYPLTETILARLEKIHKEIIALPDPGDSNADTDSDNIDAMAKALGKRPDIMEILGRNLMNTRDYIMAMQAVFNALAAATGAGDEQTSAANIAFGKKYADRIRALIEE